MRLAARSPSPDRALTATLARRSACAAPTLPSSVPFSSAAREAARIAPQAATVRMAPASQPSQLDQAGVRRPFRRATSAYPASPGRARTRQVATKIGRSSGTGVSPPHPLERLAEQLVERPPLRLLAERVRRLLGLGRLVAEPDQGLRQLIEDPAAGLPLRGGGGAGQRQELLLQLHHQPLRRLLPDAGDAREPRDVSVGDRLRQLPRLDAGEDVLRGAWADPLHVHQRPEDLLLLLRGEAEEIERVLADMGVDPERGPLPTRGQRGERSGRELRVDRDAGDAPGEVADGDRDGVGLVGELHLEAEELPGGPDHLLLPRTAVPGEGQLHLRRLVLEDRQAALPRGGERHAARLSEDERGAGRRTGVDLLHRRLRRARASDDRLERTEDGREPAREREPARGDHPGLDDPEPRPLARNHAVAAAVRAGIDAEDDHASGIVTGAELASSYATKSFPRAHLLKNARRERPPP